MKILIATKNLDKFNTISRMLRSVLGGEIELKNLNDYKDFKEEEEIGDSLQRAKNKAINAKKQIKEEFDGILGIDDGVVIKDVEYYAVRDHLYDIIVGNKIKIGEKIYISRAYYLIYGDKYENFCYNRIPYVVKKKLNSIKSVGYPLNSVLSMIDDDKVLTEKTDEELNDYYLKYSIDDLEQLMEAVKEMN